MGELWPASVGTVLEGQQRVGCQGCESISGPGWVCLSQGSHPGPIFALSLRSCLFFASLCHLRAPICQAAHHSQRSILKYSCPPFPASQFISQHLWAVGRAGRDMLQGLSSELCLEPSGGRLQGCFYLIQFNRCQSACSTGFRALSSLLRTLMWP